MITRPDDPAITAEALAEMDPALADYFVRMADEVRAGRLEARTDMLTGVPNTLGLKDRMSEALAPSDLKCERRDSEKRGIFSIAFTDCNDFGLINKILGDSAGDLALQATGEFFSHKLRHKEDFVGRKGGDEFVMILEAPIEDARKRLQELKAEFSLEVTKSFQEKLRESIPSAYAKLGELQAAIAHKHGNPALADKPFTLSLSMGARQFDRKEFADLDKKDPAAIQAAVTRIFNESDELMRNDKAAYREAQKNYGNARPPHGFASSVRKRPFTPPTVTPVP